MKPENKKIDDSAATRSAGAGPEKTFMAEVTEEFTAEDDSQLTITVGQIVTIYGEGEDQNGWFYGYFNNQDGTVSQGYLPSTYVTPLKEDADESIQSLEHLQQYDQTSAFGSGDAKPYKVANESIDQPMIDDSELEVDANTILNTYTKYLEWIAAIILFFSACLCMAHNTGASKVLGSIQLIFSFIMMAYLHLRREAFYDSPAILRAGVWFIISIFAWAAPPAGLLGGIATTAAMVSNVLSHLRDSEPAEAPYFWDTLKKQAVKYEILNYGLIIVWGLLSLCLWFIGKQYGSDINNDKLDGLVDQVEGIEGFGFVISFNIMCFLFMRCKWMLENLQIQLPLPFGWMHAYAEGIQYAFCVTITFATIGHVIAALDSYNGNAHAVFLKYYGDAPLWTGLIVFAVMVHLWALMVRPSLFYKQPGQTIYKRINTIGNPLILIVLLFHGRSGWGANYWKWMLAPIVFYLVDRGMRRNADQEQAQ